MLIFLLFFIKLSQQGTIYRYSDNYLYHSISNIEEKPSNQLLPNQPISANYKFVFKLETGLQQNGLIEIVFPDQFVSGLGVTVTASTCNYPCSITGRVVFVTINTQFFSGTEYQLEVKGVTNIATQGGCGNFALRTKFGARIIDENLNFGILGFSGVITNLVSSSVAIDSQGSSRAGQTTNYNFNFQTVSQIPQNSYIMLSFPSGYSISQYPSCKTYEINQDIIQGSIKCESILNDVIVTGLTDDIQTGKNVGIQVTVTNPQISGVTGNFRIAIFRMATSVVYNWKTNIPGVQITPGLITGVSLMKVRQKEIQSKGKLMDYKITFITKNSLNLGSVIEILFPSGSNSFIIANTGPLKYFYVESGLEDISEYNPIQIDATNIPRFIISNFKAIQSSQQIVFVIRMKNPVISGITSSILITTYVDNTFNQIIDQDSEKCVTQIQEIPSTSNPAGAVSHISNSLADQQLTNINFEVSPTVPVPNKGYVQIQVPEGFTVLAIQNSNCQVGSSIFVDSYSCIKKDNLIIVQLSIAFNIGSIWYIKINNLLKTPTFTDPSQQYLFDLTSYSIDGLTQLESWTNYCSIEANNLLTASMRLIGETSSILEVSFTSQLEIPAGTPQSQAMDEQGQIEIRFEDSNEDKLGTGLSFGSQIPCKPITGIIPLPGSDQIQCYLLRNTKTSILLKNFVKVTSGSIVVIHFPKVQVVSNSINLNLQKFKNRLSTIMNKKLISVSLTSSQVSQSSSTTTHTPTKTEVQSIFDTKFILKFQTSTAANDFLIVELPSYDIGFVPIEDVVTCFIESSVITLKHQICIAYPQTDWILVYLTDSLQPLHNPILHLNNLKWPRYIDQQLTMITRFIDGSTLRNIDIKSINGFQQPTAGTFLTSTISASKKGKSYVDCRYLFKFKAQHGIPQGGVVILTFPSGYELTTSSPSPIIQVPQFSGSYTITYTNTQITISNINEHQAESEFSILVTGVKNPVFGTSSTGWQIQTSYLTKTIDEKTNFDSFDYGSSFVAGYIIYQSIDPQPSNVNIVADYLINFTPFNEIPPSSTITITFPSEFGTLPSSPICEISGGLNSFTSCVRSTSLKIVIVTNQKYESGAIQFKIKQVTNPSTIGTTNGFDIKTNYDGTDLDVTDSTTTTGRTAILTAAPTSITTASVDLDPTNEGVQSIYTVSFVTVSALTSNNIIVIQFPLIYDQLLGDNIKCDITAGFSGAIICVVSQRQLIISKLLSVPVGTTMTFKIKNIINPNFGLSGTFMIGTKLQNSNTFIDLITSISLTSSITAAPLWLNVQQIVPNNFYARLSAVYDFLFTFSNTFPNTANGASILIQFPSQYEILDNDASLSCISNTTTFQPLGGLTVTSLNNILWINGQTVATSASSSIWLKVNNLKNPILNKRIDNFKISTHQNQRLIESSFHNLDPYRYTFSYSGPLITVNNDEDIVIERGTFSQNIFIKLDYPSALDTLTFTPQITAVGVTLTPNLIQLTKGQIQTSFQVKVPKSVVDGEYFIYWTSVGDETPPIYMPLKKSKLIITALQSTRISFSTVFEIPYGGNSLPIYLSVPNGPESNIIVTVSLSSAYSGISLDPTGPAQLTFSAGETQKQFIIKSSSQIAQVATVASGTVNFVLSGVNAAEYQLSKNYIDFQIIDAFATTPALTDLYITNITQTTAIINFGASEVGQAFYMIALYGTLDPTFALKQGPAAYVSTQSQYGNLIIGKVSNVQVSISQLIAQSTYQVYAWFINRQSTQSEQLKVQTFVTSNRYLACNFQLRLNQAYINTAEKIRIQTNVAKVLSLFTTKIQEKTYSFSRRVLFTENTRLLQTSTSIINLQLIPYDNTEVFQKPALVAGLLDSKKTWLKSLLQNLDTTFEITPTVTEFVKYYPNFVVAPIVVTGSITQTEVAFQVKLDNYGIVYATAIKSNDDTLKPMGEHIYRKMSGRNIISPNQNVECQVKFVDYSLKITQLDPNEIYNVYLIGGSVQPGYPDLMPDSQIVKISILTLPVPIIPTLNINYAKFLLNHFNIIIFILLLMNQ